ncbi:MAG TPA: peptidoglycan recognition family protein, partial [Labilithrix sp.]|nr:peptidoglycan recognition family protein [Labilithrix sp.]
LGLLAACGSGAEVDRSPLSPVGSVASALSSSASKANVPRDLLVAIAKVEDGLGLPAERLGIDIDNEVPAAGPLQLRRGKLDTLRRGAELSGVSEVDLRMYSDLALEAGALVLAELGAKTGARADDLASWSTAIAEMSGFADEAHRESYVHQDFATLARGGRFEARDGEIVVLPRHDLPPSLTLDVSPRLRPLANAEYAGAEWFPTSCNQKCTPGRGGFKIDLVLVHDTEGNWNASVATLQNDPDKSVQYIIDVDGRVGQFVTEDTTAWHAGNFNFNQRSVGIEHVGYATKPYPEAQYVSSAKLVDYLAKKYGIARDRAHIVGHDQVPNGNKIAQASAPCASSPKECQSNPNYGGSDKHTDPGIWEWATYMPRIGGTAKCNDASDRWTCSHDKTKAYRCSDGKVDVKTCDGNGGCQEAADSDATCNVAATVSPTPETPPATEHGSENEPGRSETKTPARAPTRRLNAVDASSSCALGVPGLARTNGWHLAVVGAVMLLGTRLRRRRTTSWPDRA